MNKREQALNLRLDGLTYQAIGKKLGISRQRAQQLISPPAAIRAWVIAKANGRCKHCGILVGPSGHVHHVNSTNGDDFNDLGNLQLLCVSCHRNTHWKYAIKRF